MNVYKWCCFFLLVSQVHTHTLFLEKPCSPLVNVTVVTGEGDAPPVAACAVAVAGRGGPGCEGHGRGRGHGHDGCGRGGGSGRFCQGERGRQVGRSNCCKCLNLPMTSYPFLGLNGILLLHTMLHFTQSWADKVTS